MRNRRKKSKRLFLKCVIFPAFLLLGAYVFLSSGNASNEALPAEGMVSLPRFSACSGTSNPTGASDFSGYPAGFPAFTGQISTASITDTQYLKLVNRERALADGVRDGQLVTVWPDLPARDTYVTLHESAMEAMRALFAAASQANINNLFVACGFRTHEKQRQLYENALDRSFVMPAGHSEHQLGLAADILGSGLYHTGGMAGSEEARWLAENAPQFGLILRYPADKQDITEVSYEPWHFRYVGRVHAWFMAERGFVLEEYIDYLQAQGGYQTVLEGRQYYVLYQRPARGMIFVPEDLAFRVSSANTGGFIVTAWR